MEMPQIFENKEFGKIRVVEHSGTPWFVGKDVCRGVKMGTAMCSGKRKTLQCPCEPDSEAFLFLKSPGGGLCWRKGRAGIPKVRQGLP